MFTNISSEWVGTILAQFDEEWYDHRSIILGDNLVDIDELHGYGVRGGKSYFCVEEILTLLTRNQSNGGDKSSNVGLSLTN